MTHDGHGLDRATPPGVPYETWRLTTPRSPLGAYARHDNPATPWLSDSSIAAGRAGDLAQWCEATELRRDLMAERYETDRVGQATLASEMADLGVAW